MTLVSKRLPILLAVLVGVAMALTAWSLLPSSVYADDGDLADITLDGCDVAGDDYYLLLNSKSQDDMITLDDLGVRVYAENGDEVTDNCNLELYVLLWNEEREEDVPVPVEGTRFGINDSDKGGGISEYILKAFAKDDSGYNGAKNISGL